MNDKRYKRLEIENIHQEIFRNSPECRYYFSGVAVGLYIAHQLLSHAPKDFTMNELIEAIKLAAEDNEEVSEYFTRLVNHYEENSCLY